MTHVSVHDGEVVAANMPLVVIHIEQTTEAGGTIATSSLAAIDAQRQLAQQRLALEPARIAAEQARLTATRHSAVFLYRKIHPIKDTFRS